MKRCAIGALVVAALCGVATAGAQQDFEAIGRRYARGELAPVDAIAAYEALGAGGAAERWTDDAFAEAGRIAEKLGDLPRATADLEKAAATAGDDARAAGRARAGIARIAAAMGGGAGEWRAVAAEHDRLIAVLDDPKTGDPRPTLAALAALLRDHVGYPRAVGVQLALAQAWEVNGEDDRARGFLDDALALTARPGTSRLESEHVRLLRARFLVRHDPGDAATGAAIAAIADPVMRTVIADERASRLRARAIHVGAWIAIALFVFGAVAALWRTARASGDGRASAWRRGLRALAPPSEVMFAAPIAGVIALVASTGNVLVAHGVYAIAASGLAIAWLAGAAMTGRRGAWRAAIALGAAIAAASVVYIALDRGALATMMLETWRNGPQR